MKEEVFDDPLINEDHPNSQYQNQSNNREEEADYSQTQDVKHFAGHHCSKGGGGDDFAVVKLENTADSENRLVRSDAGGIRTKGLDQNDLPKVASKSKQSKFPPYVLKV